MTSEIEGIRSYFKEYKNGVIGRDNPSKKAKQNHIEFRLTQRNNLVFGNRNIPDHFTSFEENELHNRTNEPPKTSVLPSVQPNNRRDMLKAFKAEKEKKKQAEKLQQRPRFKFTRAPTEIPLPDAGKQKSNFVFPTSKKFKPPKNLKPIAGFITGGRMKDLDKLSDKRVTRSQTKAMVATMTELSTLSDKKSAPVLEKKAANSQLKSGSKKHGKLDRANAIDLQDEDFERIIRVKSPVEIGSKSVTPPPTIVSSSSSYISPYVTVSRGKKNVRNTTTPNTTTGANYFAKVLDTCIDRLKQKANHFEKLRSPSLPEEALNIIDVAIGQTNLLIGKKFEQFRGLINDCRDQVGENKITVNDLQGFWDMLLIQVNNLHGRFDTLEAIRANNWVEVVPVVKKISKEMAKKAAAKPSMASAAIRAAVAAARLKKAALNGTKLDEAIVVNKYYETPNKKNVGLALKSETKKRISSPGLAMMLATQQAKVLNTPSRSILKTDLSKSVKSSPKVVLFEDEVDDVQQDITKSFARILFDDDQPNNENCSNKINTVPSTKISKISNQTPSRKSARISKQIRKS